MFGFFLPKNSVSFYSLKHHIQFFNFMFSIAVTKQNHSLDFLSTKFKRLLLLACLILLASACTQQEEISFENIEAPSNSAKAFGYEATFSYPSFSGEFEVASTSTLVTDLSRMNPFIENSVDNRELQIRFYYPTVNSTSKNDSKKLSVISPDAWDYMIGHQEMSGKKLRYENYRKATWYITLDQPVSTALPSYPVLIFSHGYGYNAESYSAMSAELASRGYMVVSINHTYGANPSYLSDDKPVWAKSLPKNDLSAYLSVWSDDQIFIIDQLNLINNNPDSLLFQKLDLANLGVFGHSYGGAAAYHTAAADPRIKAVIDIDGTIFNFEQAFITQPFAFILSKDHQPKFDYQHSEGKSYELRFKDFEHISFTDHILWWQWDHDELDLGLGNINGYRAIELTTEIVDDFFGHFLLSKESQWFQTNNVKTKEVSLTRKN